MNGAQDLGGMMGFGPVAPEQDEPVFHAEWERRALAVTIASGFLGMWTIDESRHARETLAPQDYLSSSYYEIWLKGLTKLLDRHRLVSADEMLTRGLPMVGEVDTRKFVRAGTADDPFTVEQLLGALLEAHITVFSRPRRSGVVDIATSGVNHAWWEILVPEADLAKATEVLEQERRELKSTEAEAVRAAEEEAAETLPPTQQ